ncbi:MAG: arginine N-succinyltransferase, partial [Myxococcota bacterium]
EIDPFDAGPFSGAAVPDVVPIRATRRLRLEREAAPDDAAAFIAATEEGGGFRAVATRAAHDGERAWLTKEACERLALSEGDELVLTPLSIPEANRG